MTEVEIEFTCAMCMPPRTRPLVVSVPIGPRGIDPSREIISTIEKRGWIVQINGDDFDVYCCKKCAI